ncbi:MAG: response regulator, partial [Planctomycetota bacterium]
TVLPSKKADNSMPNGTLSVACHPFQPEIYVKALWLVLLTLFLSCNFASAQDFLADEYREQLKKVEPNSVERFLLEFKLNNALCQSDMEKALENVRELVQLCEELENPDLILAAEIRRATISNGMRGDTPPINLKKLSTQISDEAPIEIKFQVAMSLLENDLWRKPDESNRSAAIHASRLEAILPLCPDQDLRCQANVLLALSSLIVSERFQKRHYQQLEVYGSTASAYQAEITRQMIQASYERDFDRKTSILMQARDLAASVRDLRLAYLCEIGLAYACRHQLENSLGSDESDFVDRIRKHFQAALEIANEYGWAVVSYDVLHQQAIFERQHGNLEDHERLIAKLENLKIPVRIESTNRWNRKLFDSEGQKSKNGRPKPLIVKSPQKKFVELDQQIVKPQDPFRSFVLVVVFGFAVCIFGWVVFLQTRSGEPVPVSVARHEDRMQSLERMAGGIAHEFNNYLTAIIGNIELILMNKSQDDHTRGRLQALESSTEKARALGSEMLSFAGRKSLELKRADLNQLVESETSRLEELASPHILNVKISDQPTFAEIDAAYVKVVLECLVKNSIAAIPHQGQITIQTGSRRITSKEMKDPCFRLHLSEPGLFRFIEVIDDGCGIPESSIHKIFEPFYTIDENVSPAKGAGLAKVWGATKCHKGLIRCESKKGRTSFQIFLPASDSNTNNESQSLRDIDDPEVERKDYTILIVDDDEEVRTLYRDYLESPNHHLHFANNGNEAIDFVNKLPAKQFDMLDCIFTDMEMEFMNGMQFLEMLEQAGQTIPVVVATGFSSVDVDQIKQRKNVKLVLEKPLRMQDIINALRIATSNP